MGNGCNFNCETLAEAPVTNACEPLVVILPHMRDFSSLPFMPSTKAVAEHYSRRSNAIWKGVRRTIQDE